MRDLFQRRHMDVNLHGHQAADASTANTGHIWQINTKLFVKVSKNYEKSKTQRLGFTFINDKRRKAANPHIKSCNQLMLDIYDGKMKRVINSINQLKWLTANFSLNQLINLSTNYRSSISGRKILNLHDMTCRYVGARCRAAMISLSIN